MPSWATPFFSLIAGFWFPALLIIGAIAFVVLLAGDLLTVIIKGASHVAQLATNLFARGFALAALAMVGVLAIAFLHFIPGAPNLTGIFPTNLTVPPAPATGVTTPNATPATTAQSQAGA